MTAYLIALALAGLVAIAVGGILLSAEIIRFIRGPKCQCEQSDFPTIAFRSAARPDGLAMDHADTSPCEYARLEEPDSDSVSAAT
jgi:hypothetical protein